MPSTEQQLNDLFDEVLCRAAERCKAANRRFFPFGPDTGAATWYQQLPPSEDQIFWELQPHDCCQPLSDLWAAQDLPELVALVPHLAALANAFESQQSESEDVSPFVYVMY